MRIKLFLSAVAILIALSSFSQTVDLVKWGQTNNIDCGGESFTEPWMVMFRSNFINNSNEKDNHIFLSCSFSQASESAREIINDDYFPLWTTVNAEVSALNFAHAGQYVILTNTIPSDCTGCVFEYCLLTDAQSN